MLQMNGTRFVSHDLGGSKGCSWSYRDMAVCLPSELEPQDRLGNLSTTGCHPLL
jgi:hypothetical protein